VAAATALCSDPSNTFNFVKDMTNYQRYIKTSIALLSVFFYGDQFDTANAQYYQLFSNLTGWDSTQINANFRAMGTGMAGFAMYI